MNMAMRGINVRVSIKSERTHSIPVSSSLALSIAMVGLDFPDVHEKHFPTCLRGRWLEDAARTAERHDIFCGIFHWFDMPNNW